MVQLSRSLSLSPTVTLRRASVRASLRLPAARLILTRYSEVSFGTSELLRLWYLVPSLSDFASLLLTLPHKLTCQLQRTRKGCNKALVAYKAPSELNSLSV